MKLVTQIINIYRIDGIGVLTPKEALNNKNKKTEGKNAKNFKKQLTIYDIRA
ncbi:MAG: hypothetical protein WCY19_05175 [Candidatus Gastranaerophilaceae bacterium]